MGPVFAWLLGKCQCPPNTIERVFLGNPTAITLIDRSSQRGHLCLIMLFLALKGSQRRAGNLARVFVTATPGVGQ